MALQFNPNFTLALQNIGWANIKSQNYAEALRSFNQIATDERTPQIGLSMAMCYTNQGDLENAEEMYQGVIRDDPRNFYAYNNYAGFLLRNKKDTAACKRIFQEASKHIALSANYYTSLANYYYVL